MLLVKLIQILKKHGFELTHDLSDSEHNVYSYYLIDNKHQDCSPHGRSPIWLCVDDGKISIEDIIQAIKKINIDNETKHPDHIKWMGYVKDMQSEIA